jgi:hypothetical protein
VSVDAGPLYAGETVARIDSVSPAAAKVALDDRRLRRAVVAALEAADEPAVPAAMSWLDQPGHSKAGSWICGSIQIAVRWPGQAWEPTAGE